MQDDQSIGASPLQAVVPRVNIRLTFSQAASPSGKNLTFRLLGNCLKKSTKFAKISFILIQYY